jgi:hypothetical protein
MNKFLDKNYYLIFFLSYLTIIVGFYFNEDSLGGAKHDYIYHLKFVSLFKENNFIDGLKMFGGPNYEVRNSPFFYIIYAFFDNYFSLETLRKFNTIISLFIAIAFFKCLKIRFKNEKNLILSLISCFIFLSPTVRSLSVWPYPLLWGILFFIISLFYYLLFLESKKTKKEIKYAILTSLFIILAAYIHPPLAVFNLFYLFNFYKHLKNSNIFLIILINFLFIIPAVIFLIENGIFFLKTSGADVGIGTTLNFFNKIIIISTIILYFIVPILNPLKLTKEIIYNLNYKKIILFILITILFSFFFNYKFTIIHGGGFVHKFSHMIFGNDIFLFVVFFISIICFYILFNNKINNYIIYLLIILSNIQYTIYNKYYDILIVILFFIISDIDLKRRFFKEGKTLFFFYFIYLFYYLITVFKNDIYKFIYLIN